MISRDRAIRQSGPFGEYTWTVACEVANGLMVFSAEGSGEVTTDQTLQRSTDAAVFDLLETSAPRAADEWIARNISAALQLGAATIESWEGEEWALESGSEDEPLVWASPDDARTPFAWLRGTTTTGAFAVDIYQQDDFGLSFLRDENTRPLPAVDAGSLRSRRDLPLVVGPIRSAEVVFDFADTRVSPPGLVTEALLRSHDTSTLLLAAEAYATDEWHIYDESVVALNNLDAANALEWFPPRPHWTSRFHDKHRD